MITAKPTTCQACPLYAKSKGFVPDAVVEHPEYIMVGEAPGKQEIAASQPFVGQAGHVLKNWLVLAVPTMRIAFEKNRVSVVNTLRCLPPEIQGRAYPRGEEKDQAEACCSQYDRYGEAHTVILFGESAQRRWFGKELSDEDAGSRRLGRDVKGVMGRIGRVYERDGKRWVFAPHPAWILRQPSLVEHGQQALRIASNTERVVEVDYQPWERAVRELS